MEVVAVSEEEKAEVFSVTRNHREASVEADLEEVEVEDLPVGDEII